jgi:hemerythrin-like domain-containing protein
MRDALNFTAAINTHEMVVIHRAFRRESQLLVHLIAAVPHRDIDRAAVLGRQLAWYQAGLTNHHSGEDELLWPLLHERADAGSEVVERMEHQHDRIASSLREVPGVLPAWEASAAVARRDELVRTLSIHRRVLAEHLDDEESHLLPLAARYLTAQEWAALGEHFVATTPKSELLIFLGAVLEDATDDERTSLLGAMPLAARLAWWSIGRRRYASHIRRVRGNALDNHPMSPMIFTEV